MLDAAFFSVHVSEWRRFFFLLLKGKMILASIWLNLVASCVSLGLPDGWSSLVCLFVYLFYFFRIFQLLLIGWRKLSFGEFLPHMVSVDSAALTGSFFFL